MKGNIELLAEIFHDECHKAVKEILRDRIELDYDSAVIVWQFYKMAELQIQINELNFKLKKNEQSTKTKMP